MGRARPSALSYGSRLGAWFRTLCLGVRALSYQVPVGLIVRTYDNQNLGYMAV